MRFLAFFWGFWGVWADFEIVLNANRRALFGDVLEPMYLVEWNGTLDEGQIVKIFHQWQSVTVLKITSTDPEDYRKAMPCFPGPKIFNSSFQFLPRIPTCQKFVDYSLSTLDEAQEFLEMLNSPEQGGKVNKSTSTLQNITESLKARMESLQGYIPSGGTRNRLETLLTTLETSNLTKIISSIVPCLLSSNSIDISILANLNKSQTVFQFLCTSFLLCSFSEVSSNSACFSNITENEYWVIGNMSIGSIIGDIGGKMMDFSIRRKRTKSPRDDVTEFDDNSTDVSFSKYDPKRLSNHHNSSSGNDTELDVNSTDVSFSKDDPKRFSHHLNSSSENGTEPKDNSTETFSNVPDHLDSSSDDEFDGNSTDVSFSQDDPRLSNIPNHINLTSGDDFGESDDNSTDVSFFKVDPKGFSDIRSDLENSTFLQEFHNRTDSLEQ